MTVIADEMFEAVRKNTYWASISILARLSLNTGCQANVAIITVQIGVDTVYKRGR